MGDVVKGILRLRSGFRLAARTPPRRLKMYYFVSFPSHFFIDWGYGIRLYFAIVIWRERRRRKSLQTGIVGLLRIGETQKGLQLMLPWGHR
jgi:hypothetical protein